KIGIGFRHSGQWPRLFAGCCSHRIKLDHIGRDDGGYGCIGIETFPPGRRLEAIRSKFLKSANRQCPQRPT
ncbi:hypothetical protein, partial [Mesorhizobium sp. M8A.F.Ca.ET.213.01.1.1]|uniref:hypothetical protein n=1 Tax=Mesorhizobium sp. M8A.F.Ca.ET.213.01.1.1 TaxID=2563970 RepID=UPI001AEE1CD4